MSVCLSAQYGAVLNPTGTQDDFLRQAFRSPSGRFYVAVSEHILTLFCLSTPEISMIETMDVAAICDSAGGRFAQTEGTIDGVVWSPDESCMFVSTQDTLIGVVRIQPNPDYPTSNVDEIEDEQSRIPKPDVSPYQMMLETVLVLPLREFLIVTSRDFLIVVSRHSRLLLLIDWLNYAQKAKRYILPDMGDDELNGSHSPINSVLPLQTSDLDELAPADDSIAVMKAAVTDSGDGLALLYESGIVRLFAISSPTYPISAVVACPSASSICCCGDMLAIITKQAVYCYTVSSGTAYKLKWIYMLKTSVTGISSCPQGRIFSLFHNEGITLLDDNGRSIFSIHEPAGIVNACVSTWYKLLPIIRSRSPTIEFLPLGISASLLTTHTDDFQNQVVIQRDAFKLFVFPHRKWRSIPVPVLSEQGHIGTCAVQVNPTSIYMVALPIEGNGFTLWSASTSSLAAAHKRVGVWEYFGDKSQEDKLGKIDFAAFLSETVFVTKSNLSDELVLWSVLKRVDMNQIVARIPIASNGPILASASKSVPQGYLALMHRGKVDMYKLQTTNSTDSYSLELIHKIVLDIPSHSRNATLNLIVGSHESTTSIILLSNSDAYTADGTKIASNITRIYSCMKLGSTIRKDSMVRRLNADNNFMDGGNESSLGSPMKSPPRAAFTIDDEDCALCDRLLGENVLEKSAIPTAETVAAIHRENPILWFQTSLGGLSMWVIVDQPLGNLVECIGRFSDETICNDEGGHSIVGISGQFGVMAIADNTDINRVSFASAIHPLLLVLPSPFDTWLILKRMEAGSPFLQLIVEVWLHCAITNALPILGALEKNSSSTDFFSPETLTSTNKSLCGHSLVLTVLTQLLRSFWVASHFTSIFPSTFAASVRKTEPHIMFPLAMGGSLLAIPCVELFETCMKQQRCRDAALLLLILQDKFGPLELREKFVAPLFKQSLVIKDYTLAKDLANFHLSIERSSTLLVSPTSRTGLLIPDRESNHLRIVIEDMILEYLGKLTVENNSWPQVIKLAERLGLSLRDWLVYLPKPKENDPDLVVRLGKQFKADLFTAAGQDFDLAPIFDLLLDAFVFGNWMTHAKSLCIAFSRWDQLEKLDESLSVKRNMLNI